MTPQMPLVAEVNGIRVYSNLSGPVICIGRGYARVQFRNNSYIDLLNGNCHTPMLSNGKIEVEYPPRPWWHTLMLVPHPVRQLKAGRATNIVTHR